LYIVEEKSWDERARCRYNVMVSATAEKRTRKNVKIFYPPRTDRNAYRNMCTTHTGISIHSDTILIYILYYYILGQRTLHYLQSCLRLSSNKNIKGRAPVVLRRRQLDRERRIAQHPYTQSVRPCLRVYVCACVRVFSRARDRVLLF